MTAKRVLDTEPSEYEATIKGDGGLITDLPAVVIGPATISRWTFSDAERASIAAGGDVLVFQLNDGHPLQPIGLAGLLANVPVSREAVTEMVVEMLTPE